MIGKVNLAAKTTLIVGVFPERAYRLQSGQASQLMRITATIRIACVRSPSFLRTDMRVTLQLMYLKWSSFCRLAIRDSHSIKEIKAC